MKQGWEIKKLGDICDLQNGYAFKSNDYVDYSNTMNFRMSQIRPGGGIDLENNPKYLPDDYGVKYKDYLLKEGDVVIAMTDLATETKILGVPTIVPKDNRNWLLNQRVGKLFKIDFSKIDVSYLKYILTCKSINDYYKSLGRGGLQINIGKQDILNAKIPIPPLSEQQRIVAILDEAFEAIEKVKVNAKQNLKNAKELFESYLQSVFENKVDAWEHTRLGDVCKINDGTHFSPKNTADGEYMYITAKNIKPYFLDLTKISYISEKDHRDIYARCSPVKGDVLYIKDGATAGIATINSLDQEFSLLSSVALLKCSSKILNTFLVHYMNSIIGKKNFLGYIGGAAITRLTLIKIKNVSLSLPPFKTQQIIVKKLDTLSIETKRLEAIYQKKIEDLEELKKSILQKAFNGEL